MRLYTIQISVAIRLGLDKDDSYFDITVKSGHKVFAPTWGMVMKHKQGIITDDEYISLYADMMRDSYQKNRHGWDEVLSMDEILLACYCKADSFCHRHLLRDMLVKCGAEYIGEIHTPGDMSHQRHY